MEGHARVFGQPGLHLGVLVGGVVIDDQVESEPFRRLPIELLEEAEELVVAVAVVTLAHDFTGSDVEGSEERRRAMALVIMGHRPRPALLHGQPGLGTVKGLNLTLLIDAEDDRLLWRVEVEPGDILQLRREVRITGELKRLLAVWLEAVLLPDALDRRFAQSSDRCHRPRAPLRRVERRAVERPVNDIRHLLGADARLPSWSSSVFCRARPLPVRRNGSASE